MSKSKILDNDKQKISLKDKLEIVGFLLSIVISLLSIIQIMLNLYNDAFKRNDELESCSYSIIVNINN